MVLFPKFHVSTIFIIIFRLGRIPSGVEVIASRLHLYLNDELKPGKVGGSIPPLVIFSFFLRFVFY